VKEIRSYVIRIYRRDAEGLAGVLEDVQGRRTAPFQSLLELCELLSGRRRFVRRPARPAAPPTDAATTVTQPRHGQR
jgi:hypothetical protein